MQKFSGSDWKSAPQLLRRLVSRACMHAMQPCRAALYSTAGSATGGACLSVGWWRGAATPFLIVRSIVTHSFV